MPKTAFGPEVYAVVPGEIVPTDCSRGCTKRHGIFTSRCRISAIGAGVFPGSRAGPHGCGICRVRERSGTKCHERSPLAFALVPYALAKASWRQLLYQPLCCWLLSFERIPMAMASASEADALVPIARTLVPVALENCPMATAHC